jgi:hypothetical protein
MAIGAAWYWQVGSGEKMRLEHDVAAVKEAYDGILHDPGV